MFKTFRYPSELWQRCYHRVCVAVRADVVNSADSGGVKELRSEAVLIAGVRLLDHVATSVAQECILLSSTW